MLSLAPGALAPQACEQALTTIAPNLRALFAPPSDCGSEALSAAHARALIDGLTRVAERVVVDLPCVLTAALPVAARASAYTALVVEAEAGCLRQGRRVVELLRSYAVAAERIGAIVIHRTPAPGQTLAALREALGCELLATLELPHGQRLVTRLGEEPGGSPGTDAVAPWLDTVVERLDGSGPIPAMLTPRQEVSPP